MTISLVGILSGAFAIAQAGTVIYDRSPAVTTIGTFTGGDDGEGLDLDGSFLYAVNMETGSGNLQVRDANFVTISNETRITSQFFGIFWLNFGDDGLTLDYGATTNDDNLNEVMRDSHYGDSNGIRLNLPGLTEGQDYKLQLLMNDPYTGYDRDFDVRTSVEAYPNDVIIDNLHPQNVQGYLGPTAGGGEGVHGTLNLGVVVTYTFQQPLSGGTTFQFALDTYGAVAPDSGYNNNDSILAAFTLETVLPPGGSVVGIR